MKKMKSGFLLVLFASALFIAGCSKDTEEVVSPFVGNFVISKAVLAEALSIPS